jgi:hypothetical protein
VAFIHSVHRLHLPIHVFEKAFHLFTSTDLHSLQHVQISADMYPTRGLSLFSFAAVVTWLSHLSKLVSCELDIPDFAVDALDDETWVNMAKLPICKIHLTEFTVQRRQREIEALPKSVVHISYRSAGPRDAAHQDGAEPDAVSILLKCFPRLESMRIHNVHDLNCETAAKLSALRNIDLAFCYVERKDQAEALFVSALLYGSHSLRRLSLDVPLSPLHDLFKLVSCGSGGARVYVDQLGDAIPELFHQLQELYLPRANSPLLKFFTTAVSPSALQVLHIEPEEVDVEFNFFPRLVELTSLTDLNVSFEMLGIIFGNEELKMLAFSLRSLQCLRISAPYIDRFSRSAIGSLGTLPQLQSLCLFFVTDFNNMLSALCEPGSFPCLRQCRFVGKLCPPDVDLELLDNAKAICKLRDYPIHVIAEYPTRVKCRNGQPLTIFRKTRIL